MSHFFKLLLALVLRLSLLAAAVIFLTGLIFAAALLLMWWLLRALWARLTGKPVQPWVFKMHQTDLWQRAYRATSAGNSRDKRSMDVIDAEVTEVREVIEIGDKRP